MLYHKHMIPTKFNWYVIEESKTKHTYMHRDKVPSDACIIAGFGFEIDAQLFIHALKDSIDNEHGLLEIESELR